VNTVVDPLAVTEPDPVTVTDPGRSAPGLTGPNPTGHTVTAVTRVHNCGASPMALIVACGAAAYVGLSNVTRKSKSPATHALLPEPPLTGRLVRDKMPLSGNSTPSHPDSAVPEGSRTVSRAESHLRSADPTPAIRKSTQLWIPEFAVHAIRGIETFAGKDTIGDVLVHPILPVMLSRILT